MAKRWSKYKRKKLIKKDLAGNPVAKTDINAREKEITELLQHGDVNTRRRKDGTVVLKELIDEETGKEVIDDSLDQLVSVDVFKQKYDEIQVDNIIPNTFQEFTPQQTTTQEKIKKFFLDYELLKTEIDPAGSDESHEHLMDISSRYVPQPEMVDPIPDPENLLGNGTFEEGELPKITSMVLNEEVIDDPTEIRPTAKILRLMGNRPGHIIMHKLEDKKLKRGGLYECSYMIYVSQDYDGSHGVEFSKWGNLDPDLAIMTPIGNLPYDEDKQIIKGRWLRRNFWVKLPNRGEPSDFTWKFGYPMGKRPKGVDPGDAIGSSIFKIKLHKNYVKPSPEDSGKHPRLNQLWREMTLGNTQLGANGLPIGSGNPDNGMFAGLNEFFQKFKTDFNDRVRRAEIMGTEVDMVEKTEKWEDIVEKTELVKVKKKDRKKHKGKLIHDKDSGDTFMESGTGEFETVVRERPYTEPVKEGQESIGKIIHKISIHDKGKFFEVWFALADMSTKHHKNILSAMMQRFDELRWWPSDPPQEMFNEPREIFNPDGKPVELPPVQVVTQGAPAPNINIKQPEIGMQVEGTQINQDGTKMDIPVSVGSSTTSTTDVGGAQLSTSTTNTTQGATNQEIESIVRSTLSKMNITSGGSTSAASAGGGGKKKSGFDAALDMAAKSGGLIGGVAKGVRKADRFLRRVFRRRRGRRRRRSDIRLKQNIMLMGQSNSGLNIYEWNYIWSNKRYRGVMAQELLKVKPEAVSKSFGFYSVDYDKVDVKFERVNG